MSFEIRPALPADLDAVAALDVARASDADRQAYLARAIRREADRDMRLLIADGALAGYAVMGRFFGHPFLELLFVAPDHRRRGCASALMTRIEDDFPGDRLFVSTNESNQVMRALLAQRGYRVSGMVEDLDPGDPELFFVIHRTTLDAQVLAAP